MLTQLGREITRCPRENLHGCPPGRAAHVLLWDARAQAHGPHSGVTGGDPRSRERLSPTLFSCSPAEITALPWSLVIIDGKSAVPAPA